MANFTMTLQDILENNPNEDLGLSRYPIFDEDYRAGLNQKIFNEYYNREIGGTVQEFRLWMHRRMCKIMPYYNQLYLSEKLTIDPLNTVNMSSITNTVEDALTHGVMTGENTTTGTSTVHGETTGESSSTGSSTGHGETAGETTSTGNSNQTTSANSKARTVDMQTPQNELAQNGDYATGAQDSISETGGSSVAENSEGSTSSTTNDTTASNSEESTSGTISDSSDNSTVNSDSTTTGDTTANTTGKAENITKGYTGSQAELLIKFRKTFLNIDAEIIDDLADLFMQVWTTGDSFTQHERGTHYGYYSRYWI